MSKFKADIQKRAVGEKSRVRATLVNGVTVKGHISRIEEASFDVTDKKTGQTRTIPYQDVQKIQGPGLSTGAKIGIGVGVAVVRVAIFFAIIWEKFKSGH